MNLKKILLGLENIKAKGEIDREVTAITNDSREVIEGSLFFAIKGFSNDGTQYIPTAIEKGAKVILVDDKFDLKSVEIPADVTFVVVPDARYAMAICSCNFYDNPSRKLKLIGVTGTKGKTTTTYMMKEMLQKQGYKTGLIGTIAIYSGDRKIEDSDRTTPESIKLQKILAQMVDDGCQLVVMEVSSQSLKLHRVAGCEFYAGLFTNFSEDHISPKEHPDMEDYFNSKLELMKMCKYGFINADDLQVSKVPKLLPDKDIKTYGIDNQCDLLAKDITITNSYVDFKVKIGERNERIKVGIPGRFSVYNSLAAISLAMKLGCNAENIKESLLDVRVPGRSELVNNSKELTIMIDYAHSPESLENILNAVKSYTRGRVISVFGCGGDRDSAKRPKMGEISGKIADFTIITSDNPRTEDPEKIVSQIEEGIKKTNGKYVCIVDRVEAIKYAIDMASKKDLILLAGKGHEPYQEINGVKHPFDERIIVDQIIKGEI
ncbi:MAG: UDP-N-acetylmuramoyl-L-alanyl-D-glutamate--2,6-diaminopimelate ligase [Clostridia bacterium]